MAVPQVYGHDAEFAALGMENGGCVPDGWSVGVTKDEDHDGAGGVHYYKIYDSDARLRATVHEDWNPAGMRTFLEVHPVLGGRYRLWVSGIEKDTYFETGAEAVTASQKHVQYVTTPVDMLTDMLESDRSVHISDGLMEARISIV